MEACSLTHFPSKSCINLCESNFWHEIKRATKQKFSKKKCHFWGRNDGIWPTNEEPPTESCSLTHLQSKSCTNLCEFEFWRKIKWVPKLKFFKKCHFGGQNDGIWLKSPTCWTISNKKAAKIYTNLNSNAK